MPTRSTYSLAVRNSSSAMTQWRAHVQAMLGGPLDLPMLSPGAAAIAAMAADGNANTAVLTQLVQRDPVVAANVLRVANSAALAPRVPVLTLQQAVAWLGLGEIQSIALAVVVRGQLYAANGQEKLLSLLWQQAVATACWAREIARLGGSSAELAHLCGLLLRIGRPVVAGCLSRIAQTELSRITAPERTHLIAEFERRAGLALATAWCLPEPVGTTIAHFDDEDYAGPWRPQIQQVRLAELLAARLLEQSLDAVTGERLQRTLDALRIGAQQFEALEARAETVHGALAALT
jgi:HD-like signal output (HDOD) protein